MNRTWTTLFTLIALSLSGCGKSWNDLKIEAEMNELVARPHDEGMLLANPFPGLEREIDAALSAHDSTARMHSGLFSADTCNELTAAEHRLDSARLAMRTWMREHGEYDDTLPHWKVGDLLARDKEHLLSITTEMKAASDPASNVLARYRRVLAKEIAARPSGLGSYA